MRYCKVFNERFDSKHGILSYQVMFYPESERSFVVDFGLVRRKKTAKMKKFRGLPDCRPVVVFDVVKVSRRPDPFDVYLLEKVVEPYDDRYWITLEKRREYYRVNDVFIVVSYLVRKYLEKDYLLLINGSKISIPKPRLYKILEIQYEYDSYWLERKLEESTVLERILKGEMELGRREAVYPKLVYIDPEMQRQLKAYKEVVGI